MRDPLDTLGPLEEDLLDLTWTFGTATARELCDRQSPGVERAYTTLMSTLDRLFKKGLLLREKEGLAWRYRPALSRDAFERARAELLAARLLKEDDGVGLAALVEAADLATLDRLSALIEARRRA